MKRLIILLSLSLIFVISVGCENNKTSMMDKSANNTKASPHGQHAVQQEKVVPASSIPNTEAKYSLDASMYKENNGYTLKVSTNLKLSSEHYGGTPVDGEGHIHIYLNDVLIDPIMDTSPYLLPNLQGKNTIKLVLAENNHSESFNVSKELSIE
jgi:hypothetical protein